MQLMVITLDDADDFLQTLSKLKASDMNGIVLPSTSLKHALLHSDVEPAPMFGYLSKIVTNDFESNHTLLMLVADEKVEFVKDIVRKITKGLGKKGVMFAMPVSFFEGIHE